METSMESGVQPDIQGPLGGFMKGYPRYGKCHKSPNRCQNATSWDDQSSFNLAPLLLVAAYDLGSKSNPKGSKVPDFSIFRISTSGIVTMVLCRNLIVGYLDPAVMT